MPASPALAGVLHQPFQEQLDFFRRKLNLPTERWDDIWQAAHDRAFVVAGAMKADLLNDLRTAVDKAISQGTTLAEFRRDFREIVKKHGWTGWIGEGSEGGEAWRTRTIYETNLRTSYAAGRHAQLSDPELLAERPYWRYVHSDLVARPRPQHKRWGDMNLTLPHDHPFWITHYPPNGWGCRCRVVAVRAPAEGDATEPPEGWNALNEATGTPAGIDRGWAYAPGANAATPLLDLVQQKLLNLDAPIGAQMWAQLRPALVEELATDFSGWVDQVLNHGKVRNAHALVGVMSPTEAAFYTARTGNSPVSAGIAIEDRLIVGKKAERHIQDGDALSPDEWKSLPTLLNTRREAYWDTVKQNFIYVLPPPDDSRVVKLAVEVDFIIKRSTSPINLARSGFKIHPQALKDRTRYEPVTGPVTDPMTK